MGDGPPIPDALRAKDRALERILTSLDSAIVAFSGGVDSAYLAVRAAAVLGSRAFAVTADSPSYPDHHRRLATEVAARFHLQHEFVRTSEIDKPEYRANPANRCYFCKQELYTTLAALARTRGVTAILDGTNADDRGDYRPGRQAAREHGVRSPLDEAGLAKDEIRALARAAGLPTWDEPASACLASRIPYGTAVTEARLATVEQAEALVRDLGFRVFRVRHHDAVARLEVAPDEMRRAVEPDVAARLTAGLRSLGYRHVALDLEGYRLGSLNRGLRVTAV